MSLKSLRLVVVALLIAGCVYNAVTFRFDHFLYSIDGAFQTYNAVHAFEAGSRIGVDFQSYLGVMMPIALVPLYIVLGKTLFASSASSAIMTYLAMAGSIVALARYSRIPRAYAFWCAVLVFGLMCIATPIHDAIILPQISLRPLRWSLPYLLAFAVHPLFARMAAAGDRPALRDPLLIGAIAGLALLWSNDLGIPTMLALLGSMAILVASRHGLARGAVALLVAAPVAAATAYLTITLLSGGHFRAWYDYNFVDIATDQYWLFWPWDEGHRIFSILELWKLLLMGKGVAGIILAVLAIACLVLLVQIVRRPEARGLHATQLFLYAAAIGGAVLPQLGGHLSLGYVPGAALAAPFALLVLWPGALRRGPGAAPHASRLGRVLPLLALVTVVVLHGVMLARLYSVLHRANPAETAVFIPELGVWTRDAQAPAVQAVAASRAAFAFWPPERRVFADYYSAINIAADAAQSSPLPTVIHALGERQRARFQADLLRTLPPIATTPVTLTTTPWEAWNFRASWPFYRLLIERYEPFAASSHHLFWRRRVTPLPGPYPVACTVRGTADGVATLRLQADGPHFGSAYWMTDVAVALDAEAVAPRFRTLTERPVISARPPAVGEALFYLNGYGLPASRQQRLMMTLQAGPPKIADLRALPSRAVYGVPTGRCRARALLPDPYLQPWPALTKPLLDKVLREERQREERKGALPA